MNGETLELDGLVVFTDSRRLCTSPVQDLCGLGRVLRGELYGEQVAVKHITRDVIAGFQETRFFDASIKHENLVRFLGFRVRDDDLYVHSLSISSHFFLFLLSLQRFYSNWTFLFTFT